MKLSEHKVNVDNLEQGAWVDKIPEMEGLRLKVRGANNRDWRKLQQRLILAVPRRKRMNGLDPDEQDRINSILLRDTSLLDWDGLDDDEGKPIPFSKERANEYLTDPQYGKFRDAVMWAANVVSDEDQEEVEQAAGN